MHTKLSYLIITCLSIFFMITDLNCEEIKESEVKTSMENSEKKLRFFGLNLHVSVIADVRVIFESMGHEVVDWNISGHSWVFGREKTQVDIVNDNTWRNLDQAMCDQFYERYKDYLDQFDCFIVAFNAPFALLYEKFNKPIIIINPARYEAPFTLDQAKWSWLDNFLIEGVKKNQIFIVSNNKGDQQYLEYFTGIKHDVIPSLCLYTNSQYTGKKDGFLIHSWTADTFLGIISNSFKEPQLIQNSNFHHPYQWQDLYDYKGLVHFPYQISTMSIFEQYSANVPLFFPTKRFLEQLQLSYPNTILSQLSWYSVYGVTPTTLSNDDPNNVLNKDIVKLWIDTADFYDEENMPYIQYFDSYEELEYLLKTVDCETISLNMKNFNIKRQKLAYKKWQEILQQIILSL